jgi:hypothetical protein
VSASLGLPMLTATMTAGEPNVTPYQLQANCEKLAAETFGRETVDDEDRLDYRAHYSGLKECLRAKTYISLTPVGINTWVYWSDLPRNQIRLAADRIRHSACDVANVDRLQAVLRKISSVRSLTRPASRSCRREGCCSAKFQPDRCVSLVHQHWPLFTAALRTSNATQKPSGTHF